MPYIEGSEHLLFYDDHGLNLLLQGVSFFEKLGDDGGGGSDKSTILIYGAGYALC